MAFKICKECGKPFNRQLHGEPRIGRKAIYCPGCSTPTAYSRRANANRLKRYTVPDTFNCWLCQQPSSDSTTYPLCGEDCQDALIPALAKELGQSRRVIQYLAKHHGLFTCLQSPAFSLADFNETFAEHLTDGAKVA